MEHKMASYIDAVNGKHTDGREQGVGMHPHYSNTDNPVDFPVTRYVHIVYVHPVYDGILQTHKVVKEMEYSEYEFAEAAVNHYNETATQTRAVYYGCVNDATGELV